MASVNSVQFRGADAVLAAYVANAVPDWAMVCGKEILFQYTGGDLEDGGAKLEGWLEMLKEGHSSSQYQLRLYFDPGGPITNKTDFNQSFRFVLFGNNEEGSITGLYHTMTAKMKALEDRLDNEKEEEEEKGLMGMVNGMMANPEIQQFLMQKVVGLIGGLFGGNKSPQLGAIAGVPVPAGADAGPDRAASLYDRLPEAERVAFDQAIEILLDKDPQVGTHLAKLAAILRDQPAKYSMYAAML